jgi:CubicO group peptidase (beta-lactamase class C family)
MQRAVTFPWSRLSMVMAGICLWACGGSSGRSVNIDGSTETDTANIDVFEWETVSPGEVGLNEDLLEAGRTYIADSKLPVSAMLVIQNGKIAFEHYFNGYDANTRFNIESSTKSITSVLVGMAIDEHLIDGVDAAVTDILKDVAIESDSREKRAMTVENLLTMQSGLAWDNNVESFLERDDTVSFILNHGMREAPGNTWSYSSADTQLLGAIIEVASGKSLRRYAEERLFRKLGVTPGEWLTDSGGHAVAGFGLQLTARDMARFGLFMVQGGVWQGQQLISREYVEDALNTHASTPWSRGDFGYSFWIKPIGGYCAGGRFGQQINFFPEENLVVVYTASLPLESADATLDQITEAFVLGTAEPPVVDSEENDSDTSDRSACDRLDADWHDTAPGVPYAIGMLTYGDDISTRCLLQNDGNQVCLMGHGADAGANYDNWGAGLQVRLAATDEDGEATVPFDAAAHGIFGVSFTVDGADTLPFGLRVGLSMVNRSRLPFETNGFIINGASSGDIRDNGTHSFAFTDLKLPFWSEIENKSEPFDATQIFGLNFQTVTQPGVEYNYQFCICEIIWLDENMLPMEGE